MQLADIAMETQDILLETPDIGYQKAFYDLRNKYGQAMTGLKKEQYKEVFTKVKEELAKPLHAYMAALASDEQALKQRVIDAIYQVSPEGPDHCRELVALAQKVRSDRDIEYLPAIRKAMSQGITDDGTNDDLIACWPADLDDDETKE